MTELALVRESAAPQSLEDWKTYIAAASSIEKRAGHALVDAIIEKGRRIAEFHAAYKAKGQHWGKRWEDVCVDTIGISCGMATKYISVGKDIVRNANDILPTSVETLYCLSSIARKDAPAFDAAVVAGEINPKMTLPKARALAERIQNKSATAKTVKKNGSALRRPNKRAHQDTIAIPYEDVITKLRPLIKRVKEQSNRHAATVSFTELSLIAHLLAELADAWMKNGLEPGTHSEPVPLNRVHKGR